MITTPRLNASARRKGLRWFVLGAVCLLIVILLLRDQIQQLRRSQYPTVATERIVRMESAAHFPGETSMIFELDFGVVVVTHGVLFDAVKPPYELLQVKEGPDCLYACLQGKCAEMAHATPANYNVFTAKQFMTEAMPKHSWLQILVERKKSCQL